MRTKDKGHSTIKQNVTAHGIQLTNSTHAHWILNALNDSRKDGDRCDVILKVENERIPAHRNVLMVASEYFQAMFSIHMQERHSKEVPIVGLDGKTVRSIVDYFYTGNLLVDPDDVQDLLVACDMLQVLPLKEQCELYLVQRITCNNCFEMLQFGEQYSCRSLLEKAMTLARLRFLVLSEFAGFKEADIDTFQAILKSDFLALERRGECAVVETVLAWLDADPENRISQIKQLLPYIRWPYVNCNSLEKFKCHEYMKNITDIITTVDQLRNETGHSSRNIHTKILVLGGYLQSRTGPVCPRLESVEMYDFETSYWHLKRSLNQHQPSFVHAFVINGRLLCLTLDYTIGVYGRMGEGQVMEYNIIHNEWEKIDLLGNKIILENLYFCIKERGVVFTHDGTIYTMSHLDVHSIELVERNLDLRIESLHLLPPVPSYKDRHTVDMAGVVCGGSIYAIGGADMRSETEVFPQKDIYRLKSGSQEWKKCTPMKESRAKLTAVELDGLIYVVGGYNMFRMCSAEVYYPVNDTWDTISNMEKPRSHHSSVAAQGKIYVLGGKSSAFKIGGARKVLNRCEVYDPETNAWSTNMEVMSTPRCMTAAVIF